MTYLIIGFLIIGGIAFLFANSKNKSEETLQKMSTISVKYQSEKEIENLSNDSLTYSEKLNKTKELYPFEKWRKNFLEYQMEQYTEENCNEAKNIFDNLISKLLKIGENGNRNEKEKYFEIAVKSLNKLNEKDEGIIETGEREDLCELIDRITLASGLKPKNYAEGEGIADLYREW
ncbi:hypothetical protein [Frigoriflavimonas asaccharolytica]|uniref:Uncharacterized protein n=1 Tax=Frigoriflavimonas asaccharolytica TaxID=2735899 RepID=A0A8J8G7Y7_9FLAO|nr:hypothetical protein [Frigoriflavimonas asaccharolytica]NRS93148.1 hypothetical protein [Frigoriflavimonas asaccharolytica]